MQNYCESRAWNKEAYVFLKDLHAELPDTPFAQKGIVLERIRDLENELEIPFWERYQPNEDAPDSVN